MTSIEGQQRREQQVNPYSCACLCHARPGAVDHERACCGPWSKHQEEARAEEEAKVMRLRSTLAPRI